MNKKQLKNFIIMEIIITILFSLIICGIFYVMQNVIWWKTMLVVLIVSIIYMSLGALNIVINIKNKL